MFRRTKKINTYISKVIIVLLILVFVKVQLIAQTRYRLGKPRVTELKNPKTNPAGQKYNIKIFGIEQNLPSIYTYDICEDIFGNIWIATDDGLSRFNGYEFDNFYDCESTECGSIRCITENERGEIWFGGQNELFHYDGKKIRKFEFGGAEKLVVYCVHQTDDESIWIGTDHGLYKKTSDKTQLFYLDQGLVSSQVLSLSSDKNGYVWIGTSEGLQVYDGRRILSFGEDDGLVKSVVNSLYRSVINDTIWVGTNNGLYKYLGENRFMKIVIPGLTIDKTIESILEDKMGNLLVGTKENGLFCKNGQRWINFNINSGLSSNHISKIFVDRKQNTWLASMNGICRLSGDYFTYFSEESGLAAASVMAIEEVENGEMLYGTYGKGLVIYDGKTFNNYSESEGFISNSVWAFDRTPDGSIWMATLNGTCRMENNKLFVYDKNTSLPRQDIRSFHIDKKGNMWLGTNNGIMLLPDSSKKDGEYSSAYLYLTDDGLIDNNINSIIEDNAGTIWIGTDKGLCSFADGGFTTYDIIEEIASPIINCLTFDEKGRLWIGCNNCGLVIFENGHAIQYYNTSNGLPNNDIWALLNDSKGAMWVGTNKGICKMVEQDSSFSIRIFGIAEGFIGNDVNHNAVFEDSHDNLWWGTGNLLTCYNPQYELVDSIAPVLVIDDLQLFFKKTDWSLKDSLSRYDSVSDFYHLPYNLKLSYNENHLSFHYTGINQFFSEKTTYRYTLEGLDNDWIEAGYSRLATYSHIPPGDYTFKVKAANSDGAWSEVTSFSFSISPPFWATWWFRTISIMFVFGLGFFLYKQRIKGLKRQQQILELKVKQRTKQLREKSDNLELANNEIIAQKAAVDQRNEEIMAQRDELQLQKTLIEEKNNDITDSIMYAKRIQEAILPAHKLLNEYLEEAFLLFLPKDIVSGDFFWIEKVEDKILIAVVDCTGHGVPGAFVSLIGFSGLNKAVNEEGLRKPSEILNSLNLYVNNVLRNEGEGEDETVKDGMDLALVCFDTNTLTLEYSGANNPLYIFRKDNLDLDEPIEIIKADKRPIGAYHDCQSYKFTNRSFSLSKGDMFYIFSDGYVDQFGTIKRKKFKSKNFRKLLVNNSNKSMSEQKDVLMESFNEWRSGLEQIDDITVVGVRV